MEGTSLVEVTQARKHVSAGDILVEIVADMFDVEIPSLTAGVLDEILIPIGTTGASRPGRNSTVVKVVTDWAAAATCSATQSKEQP